jgi:hypothetical protein
MANNDAYSFTETESMTDASAAEVSTGFTVQKQATRMGCTVICTETGTIDGNYTAIVETADTDEAASGGWLENSLDSISFNAAGTFQIQLTSPILDKVRLRLESTGTVAQATFVVKWLADTELTAVS